MMIACASGLGLQSDIVQLLLARKSKLDDGVYGMCDNCTHFNLSNLYSLVHERTYYEQLEKCFDITCSYRVSLFRHMFGLVNLLGSFWVRSDPEMNQQINKTCTR